MPEDDLISPDSEDHPERTERDHSRHQMLQDVVALLQQEPLAYRHFGVFWWRLKAMLKAEGFTRRQLHILGDYTEPAQVDRFADMSDEDFWRAAMIDQQHNVRFRPFSRVQTDPITGEEVTIFDQDMGA